MLDLTHVPQAVLVDPALGGVEAGDAHVAGDAGAERRGDLGRERSLHDDLAEDRPCFLPIRF